MRRKDIGRCGNFVLRMRRRKQLKRSGDNQHGPSTHVKVWTLFHMTDILQQHEIKLLFSNIIFIIFSSIHNDCSNPSNVYRQTKDSLTCFLGREYWKSICPDLHLCENSYQQTVLNSIPKTANGKEKDEKYKSWKKRLIEDGYFTATRKEMPWRDEKEKEKKAESEGKMFFSRLASAVRSLVQYGTVAELEISDTNSAEQSRNFEQRLTETEIKSWPLSITRGGKVSRNNIFTKFSVNFLLGWLPSFILLFDEVWELVLQLEDIMSHTSGGGHIHMDS